MGKAMKSVANDQYTRSGVATIKIWAAKPDKVRLYGLSLEEALKQLPDNVRMEAETHAIVVTERNAYVRSGTRNSLLREWGLGGTSIAGIGVASNTTAVTVDTRFLNGATGGLNGPVSGQTVSIKAFSPAAAIITDGAGVVQSVTGGATYTNADFFNSIPFAWAKLGLVLAIPASNAVEIDGNLVDVIGGTGGSSPYNRTFSLDVSNAGTFSIVAQIKVSCVAT